MRVKFDVGEKVGMLTLIEPFTGYGQPAGAQCPGKIRFKPFDTGSGLV